VDGANSGTSWSRLAAKSVEVAVVVVFVADQHAVESGQVADVDGDGFALVVAGSGTEPGAFRKCGRRFDQAAAADDAGDRGRGHGRFSSVG